MLDELEISADFSSAMMSISIRKKAKRDYPMIIQMNVWCDFLDWRTHWSVNLRKWGRPSDYDEWWTSSWHDNNFFMAPITRYRCERYVVSTRRWYHLPQREWNNGVTRLLYRQLDFFATNKKTQRRKAEKLTKRKETNPLATFSIFASFHFSIRHSLHGQ